MRSHRSLPVRVKLTLWYVAVLAAVLLLYVAGTSIVLYVQLSHQLLRFAIQDVETIEGLLFFSPDGTLHLDETYHNHPNSRQVLERLLEVISPNGTVLYRNERLGNHLLGGPPFAGEGVGGYSERSAALDNGSRVLLVSRRHSIAGHPVLIRLAYEKSSIWARIEEFLTASITALPLLLALAAVAGYQLAKRTLAPLETMARQAEKITAERLDQRLPVHNPEDELGYLARVVNDVLDRLQRAFDQLRRFTSDASHELRTPLAAIRSVGEVGLQRDRTPEQYQDTIGSMLEEVTRLTKLTENLLTISRADAGQIQLTHSAFSVRELICEVVALVEVLAEERSQMIHILGDGELRIVGDRMLLRQALINVLHNAVKFSPIGGSITIRVAEGPPSHATIFVTDNGPGIPPEHRARVFDRFYRVDTGRTREAGGAGLGLSIANWAIVAQGGRIRIEDTPPDSGATFAIEMPLSDSVPAASVVSLAP